MCDTSWERRNACEMTYKMNGLVLALKRKPPHPQGTVEVQVLKPLVCVSAAVDSWK